MCATGVAFNGTSATFAAVSDTQITATVPSGATVGPISVANSTGKVTSVAIFTEVPAITSFSPTSGTLGTAVTTFVMGALVAWVVERTDAPGAGLFHMLSLLSFAVPGLLMAMGPGFCAEMLLVRWDE